MKRRWSVLFWSSLASLIGLSWLASSFGIGLSTLISGALVGMVIATALAFIAMVKDLDRKWPAAVALICAGPMAIEVLKAVPDVAMIIRFLGAPFALIMLGTIATVASAVAILTMAPPKPPEPPPVAPARVID
ncbi:MAG TPA: hypothetical protein VLB44_10685 [Kofleriaceae bacterium]|nr:hypothetical protein [Kofleriaceae bacterium]